MTETIDEMSARIAAELGLKLPEPEPAPIAAKGPPEILHGVHIAGATEDPATGSVAGPLLAYLHERTGLRTLDIHQGVEMGRRSLLRCRFDEETERLRVGGDVVILAQGTVSLPATGRMSSPR